MYKLSIDIAMKRYILILVLVTASEISGNLLNQTKVEIETAQRTENVTGADLKKVKHVVVKNVSAGEQNVYLEDVFYKLKSLNWSEDQETCFKSTLWMLSSLKNFSLWAVWEWDSISSEPIGLLSGNHYQLGNFDECLYPPWGRKHPELATQYCLTKITLERNGPTKKRTSDPYDPYSSTLDFLQYHTPHSRPKNELFWGVCVPSSCNPASVERLMAILLSRSHLGTTGMTSKVNVAGPCQKSMEEDRYDAPFYGFWVLVGLFVVVGLVCTYINARIGNDPKTIGAKIIQAFSFEENAESLMKVKANGSEILYGIRLFTMVLIVFDHNVGISNAGAVSDGVKFDGLIHSVFGMFIIHDDLLVDSYFFLSGFLVISALMSFKRPPNPIALIIKRYVRLTVGFAITVFFMSAVLPFAGSGPLWPICKATEVDTCKKNWWLSLLMLNNYIDSENICLVATWYIPCDFHFFVITVAMYVLYQKLPKISKGLGVLITLAAFASPGIVNYVNELPAIQLFTHDFLVNVRGNKQFNLAYIKSHARMATYIIGLASGYLFTKQSQKNNLNCISKKWSIIGSLFGLVLMLTMLVVGTLFLTIPYTQLQGSIYAAIDRPLWTIGLAIFVLCCCLGDVPFLKSFLSWYPWVPISRLTYGLYLVHTVILARNTFVARNPVHNDTAFWLNNAMATVVWGNVAALALFLVFEAPLNKLVVVLLSPRSRNHDQKQTPEASAPPPGEVGSNFDNACQLQGNPGHLQSNPGHLQGNLPSVIQYSSKI